MSATAHQAFGSCCHSAIASEQWKYLNVYGTNNCGYCQEIHVHPSKQMLAKRIVKKVGGLVTVSHCLASEMIMTHSADLF